MNSKSINLSRRSIPFYIILSMLVSVMSIAGHAQQPVVYTLNDVVELAQKQSPDAQIAKFTLAQVLA